MKLQEFFNTEFKDFSNLDNVRSIPSIIDGFKDAQRKAVYGMIKHGNNDIKVAQAAGKFALVTHYAHGEGSMAETIVGLAQDFPGSNNINLFEPIGQFGSILSSESSSHRYIFTKPSSNLRNIIKNDDDCILEHRYEDGDKAEPLNFYPVIPMWLINGAVGIGTGHSVKILPRDPQKVSNLIKKLTNGNKPQQKTIDETLIPTFCGWTGKVIPSEEVQGRYEIHGILEKVNTTTLNVTELPVGYGVDKFKAILVDLMDKNLVKDFDNNSTEEGFDFTITIPREVGKKSHVDLMKMLKLIVRMTENITLWTTEGQLKRYNNVYDALLDFVEYRIDRYEDRRKKHIELFSDDQSFLEDKLKFILIWNDLENPGKMKTSLIENTMVKEGVREESLPKLMSMRISSLTLEQVEELKQKIKDIKQKITVLEKTQAGDMYSEDLKLV